MSPVRRICSWPTGGHLRPEEAVFEAMLAGFAGQQSGRLLSVVTIATREAIVRRFALFTGN